MQRKKTILKITIITVLLFISLDFLIGKAIYKKLIRKNFKDSALGYHVDDPIYDHRFKPGYNDIVGSIRYRLCTDQNGFRTSCDRINENNKKFDLGIIGDSFTEGVALNFEDTYVGMIAKELSHLKIANLAVSSYSPAIYLTKINYLISNDYKFDEIIIFLDLSDLTDDTVCYTVEKLKVKRRETANTCFEDATIKSPVDRFKIFSKNRLRLSYELYELIKNYLLKIKVIEYRPPSFKVDIRRSNWTYDYDPKNYNNYSYNESVKIMTNHMNQLSELLKKNNIQLSIAVYPWPGTLKYDVEKNKHFKIWKSFCEKSCFKFYNLNKPFFELLEKEKLSNVLQKYYLKNDIHFSREGSKIIAENFLRLFKQSGH
tara:strand:+ start:8874 stop:9989 length:1116 start_codon:yes stop_codon:yes gene_type:complete